MSHAVTTSNPKRSDGVFALEVNGESSYTSSHRCRIGPWALSSSSWQMTVSPYVLLSLIAGLGGLSYQQAAALARKGGAVLVLLWTVGVTMVLLMPLAFPNWQTASFFSATLIQQPPTFNFLSLYIPANPFYSLSNNIVPAVVVFSVFVGVALIGINEKGPLLNSLGVCINALGRVTGWIVRLAPSGVFAIIASATGAMRLPDSGSAWTLIYPAFSVAVPQPDVLAVPLAYGVPRGERNWPTLSILGST